MTQPTIMIPGTDEAWDEGLLGTDEQYVVRSTYSADQGIDIALALQPISIRLQKGLLESLKELAALVGIGYQPLIRQVLTRYVASEMKRIAQGAQ